MVTKLVKVEEVVRHFLVSEMAKDHTINHDGEFEIALEKYKHVPQAELFSLVKDRERLQRFTEHSWTTEDVELRYIGAWPTVGDLPEAWCQLSVVDIANLIKENLDSCKDLESVQKILDIQKNIDRVLQYFYPILVSGGEIRNDTHLQFLPFDADDGSHRLIATALAGRKTVLAYVGIV